ncbi:hypothetical protein [Streptomyces sp. SPB074]|uniref:hypothetical protein n=1 Tax=Streptomyces sp. (strain SPB074) TaxID=465543 RepID=UPI00017F102F|nr:hypothetical protein [Streptomyces sp. SPB074]EDY42894.1 hypothetical protein SSBG_00856 [Streptomyces sp. SPB074]
MLPLLFPALWFWSGPLRAGTWHDRPGRYAGTAALLLAGAGLAYLAGALAGASLDPEEA